MAKSSSERKTPPTGGKSAKPAPPRNLAAELAAVDGQLAELLQARARLLLEGQTAAKSDPALTGAVAPLLAFEPTLDRVAAHSKGPLSERSLRAIYREVVSAGRALVREPRVAVLGPLYSYSHLAAIHRFGQSVEFVPVGTIAAAFEEVYRKQCEFGIVPIENSTDGRIADSLDMFTRLPVPVTGEVQMAIHHTLLGRCARHEVLEVYSRPQALSQCRNWLARHLPTARTIEVTSTSTAAQLAKEKPGAAAIASRQAGNHYGLDVLAENIEDVVGNTTRFAVIGGEPPKRTGYDRTAMLFQMEHRPGTLAEAMNIFKRNQVNLTWIESFPIPSSERAYLFFVEMEGHQVDLRLRKAVRALGRKALRLEILGSFPAGKVVD